LPNGTVEDLKSILEGADGIYLSKELASKVDSKLIEANMQQKEISLEEEIELFKVVMSNFGLLFCFATNLGHLPIRLKYAIISRVMYEFGSCGVPETLGSEYFDLLSSDSQTFWPINPDGSEHLREIVLSDPLIGVEPLLDEFEATDWISMLTTLISNPVFPREILIDIASGSHDVLGNLDEDDADQLLNCAKEIIAQ